MEMRTSMYYGKMIDTGRALFPVKRVRNQSTDKEICVHVNDRGMVLPVALMFLTILAIVGGTAALLTTTDLKIGGNYKSSEQAIYTAEAGVAEARARLKLGAVLPINDGHPTKAQWSTFIGDEVKAKGKGYDISNAMHVRTISLQSTLDYTVRIAHQTDGLGNVLYYGDSDGDGINERNTAGGKNIYVISSLGIVDGAIRTVDAEVTKIPPIASPAALYVEASTTVQGNTSIIGTDGCGISDLPGVVTTQAPGSVTIHGLPTISGADGTLPNISYDAPDLDVQSIVDAFKGYADYSYAVDSETHTGTAIPGPGDGWGTPISGMTLQDPSSCSQTRIVHYDTDETDITLSGGVTGCGILLVEGDLELRGDFSWYGIIVTTGSVMFTGGGNSNITGTMIAGGSADGDIIGGNTNIVYCSSAVSDQIEARPLKILSWKEKM